MKGSRIIAAAVLLAFVFGLSACANTVRGVGKDLKDTARAVEQAAT